MNSYAELLYYIESLGEADVFVNTVTKTGDADLDTYKANIFPILDVFIGGGSFPSNALIRYNVSLTCVDLRNINKEIVNDKFSENDNEIDNHTETIMVLNRIWLLMKRDFAENNITASETPTFEKITLEGSNLYDGWQLSFDVDVPNTTIDLC